MLSRISVLPRYTVSTIWIEDKLEKLCLLTHSFQRYRFLLIKPLQKNNRMIYSKILSIIKNWRPTKLSDCNNTLFRKMFSEIQSYFGTASGRPSTFNYISFNLAHVILFTIRNMYIKSKFQPIYCKAARSTHLMNSQDMATIQRLSGVWRHNIPTHCFPSQYHRNSLLAGFEIKVGCGARIKKVSEVTKRKKRTYRRVKYLFFLLCVFGGTFGSPGNARHAALGGALERSQTLSLSLSLSNSCYKVL